MSEVDFLALIQEYAILITALGGAAGGIAVLWRKGIKPMWSAIKNYNDMLLKIDKIYEEVQPNGGTSIKDTIGNVSKDVTVVKEMQFAILVDHEDAYFKTDPKGNCTWVNRTYCRTVERTPTELLGQGWQNALAQEDREKVVSAWQDSMNTNRELTLDFRFETPNGKIIPARVRSYRMVDSKGEVIGYLGNIKVIGNHTY